MVFSTFFLQHMDHQAYHQDYHGGYESQVSTTGVWPCLEDWVDCPHSFSPVKIERTDLLTLVDTDS